MGIFDVSREYVDRCLNVFPVHGFVYCMYISRGYRKRKRRDPAVQSLNGAGVGSARGQNLDLIRNLVFIADLFEMRY